MFPMEFRLTQKTNDLASVINNKGPEERFFKPFLISKIYTNLTQLVFLDDFFDSHPFNN